MYTIVTEYIGYVAGATTVLSFLPQVRRAWKTKEVKDISAKMIILLLVAGGLWITYGILSSDVPVILTNVGMVSLNALLMTAKVRFG